MDIFRDLNLYSSNNNKSTLQEESIICTYETEQAINQGDIVTFKDNKVVKAMQHDIPNALAIENSCNNKVKCQVSGIAKLNNLTAGATYYFSDSLTTENNGGQEIGKALSETELLIKNNVFIDASNEELRICLRD